MPPPHIAPDANDFRPPAAERRWRRSPAGAGTHSPDFWGPIVAETALPKDSADRGRIVVVAAGFALWKGGRCIAAARWGDVRRIAARPSATLPRIALVTVTLADGAALEMREDAPGFDPFMDVAFRTLPGVLPFLAWHPALVLSDGPAAPVDIYLPAPKKR